MIFRLTLSLLLSIAVGSNLATAGEEEYFDYEQIRADAEAGIRSQVRNERIKEFVVNGAVVACGVAMVAAVGAMIGSTSENTTDQQNTQSSSGSENVGGGQSYTQPNVNSNFSESPPEAQENSPENNFSNRFKDAATSAGTFLGQGAAWEFSRDIGRRFRDTQQDIIGLVFASSGAFDGLFEYRIARHIQQYLLEKDLIDESTNRYIDTNLYHLHLILNSPSKNETYNQIKIRNILEGIRCVFKLPKSVKRLRASRDLKNRLDVLTESYPENFRKDIETTILEIIDNSRRGPDFTPRKVIPFFIGAPGTGKTYLANKLSNLVDLPFVEISLADVEDPSHVFGSDEDNFRDGAPLQNFRSLSLFSRAILTAKNSQDQNFKNVIILIDEIDRLLNAPRMGDHGIGVIQNIMLRLLDPDRTCPYFRQIATHSP